MRARIGPLIALISSLSATLPSGADEPVARSIGTPQAGQLVGGEALPLHGDGWVFVTNRGNPRAHFGTGALVRTLTFAIAAVREHDPGGTLVVQDMSLPGGGPIQGHASHTSGRDADLRYYAVDAQGAPIVTPRDVPFGADGRARDGSAGRFDDARNWTLVAALLESPWAEVQAIFIHPALERRLIAYGRRHASAPVVTQAAHVMRPPGSRRAAPHDDHLHIRIGCPGDDAAHGCVQWARRRGRPSS